MIPPQYQLTYSFEWHPKVTLYADFILVEKLDGYPDNSLWKIVGLSKYLSDFIDHKNTRGYLVISGFEQLGHKIHALYALAIGDLLEDFANIIRFYDWAPCPIGVGLDDIRISCMWPHQFTGEYYSSVEDIIDSDSDTERLTYDGSETEAHSSDIEHLRTDSGSESSSIIVLN